MAQESVNSLDGAPKRRSQGARNGPGSGAGAALDPPLVFIGYDEREAEAFEVAEYSLRRNASGPVCVVPLRLGKLTEQGVIDRPYRIYRGGIWDIPSDAPASTEFATTRFLAPLLAQRGFAAFMDCDTVTVGDVYELWRLADPRYAVQVVKHEHAGTEGVKMDGQPQTQYPRKNWSSVVLWNVDHPGNRRLTRAMICNLPGRELHAFCWLRDEEIGELPAGWNWLVSVQAMPDALRLAHFTLGGPWLPGWHGGPYDDLWSSYQADFRAAMRAGDARGGPGTG